MTEAIEVLDAMKRLSNNEKLWVINQLVVGEDLSLLGIIHAEAERLEKFRKKARNDIRKLAEAGMYLGEKQIKKIPTLKEKRERQLQAALARTLLSTGIREGTKSGEKIKATVDFTEIDEKWYQDCWALESVQPSPQM